MIALTDMAYGLVGVAGLGDGSFAIAREDMASRGYV